MLHEASTIAKAIEKAWNESGKPVEFTIKVLETGEKNFLGFTKRPSIVSITFDPRKQPYAGQRAQREIPNRNINQSSARDHDLEKNRNLDKVRQEPRPNIPSKQERPLYQTQQQPAQKQQTQLREIQDEPWTEQWTDHVTLSLKEILQHLQITTPFSAKSSMKALTITFEKRLCESHDDERALFISLSYLLIQFLKKKFKKKFRGYQLIVTTTGLPK